MALLRRWWQRLASAVRRSVAPVPAIPPALWLQTLQHYPFLLALTLQE